MVAGATLAPSTLALLRNQPGLLDLRSAALSLAAVLAVIYGLKQIAEDGPAVLPALSIAAGIAVGVAFVRRQRTLADPLIDLGLFGERTFSVSLGAFVLILPGLRLDTARSAIVHTST